MGTCIVLELQPHAGPNTNSSISTEGFAGSLLQLHDAMARRDDVPGILQEAAETACTTLGVENVLACWLDMGQQGQVLAQATSSGRLPLPDVANMCIAAQDMPRDDCLLLRVTPIQVCVNVPGARMSNFVPELNPVTLEPPDTTCWLSRARPKADMKHWTEHCIKTMVMLAIIVEESLWGALFCYNNREDMLVHPSRQAAGVAIARAVGRQLQAAQSEQLRRLTHGCLSTLHWGSSLARPTWPVLSKQVANTLLHAFQADAITLVSVADGVEPRELATWAWRDVSAPGDCADMQLAQLHSGALDPRLQLMLLQHVVMYGQVHATSTGHVCVTLQGYLAAPSSRGPPVSPESNDHVCSTRGASPARARLAEMRELDAYGGMGPAERDLLFRGHSANCVAVCDQLPRVLASLETRASRSATLRRLSIHGKPMCGMLHIPVRGGWLVLWRRERPFCQPVPSEAPPNAADDTFYEPGIVTVHDQSKPWTTIERSLASELAVPLGELLPRRWAAAAPPAADPPAASSQAHVDVAVDQLQYQRAVVQLVSKPLLQIQSPGSIWEESHEPGVAPSGPPAAQTLALAMQGPFRTARPQSEDINSVIGRVLELHTGLHIGIKQELPASLGKLVVLLLAKRLRCHCTQMLRWLRCEGMLVWWAGTVIRSDGLSDDTAAGKLGQRAALLTGWPCNEEHEDCGADTPQHESRASSSASAAHAATPGTRALAMPASLPALDQLLQQLESSKVAPSDSGYVDAVLELSDMHCRSSRAGPQYTVDLMSCKPQELDHLLISAANTPEHRAAASNFSEVLSVQSTVDGSTSADSLSAWNGGPCFCTRLRSALARQQGGGGSPSLRTAESELPGDVWRLQSFSLSSVGCGMYMLLYRPEACTWTREQRQVVGVLHHAVRNLLNSALDAVQTALLQRHHIKQELKLRDAALKREFAAHLSHELRSPFMGVLSMLDILADMPLQSEQGELVSTARASVQTLLRLLNDVLDMSRAEAVGFAMETHPFRPSFVAVQVAEALRGTATLRGIELAVEITPHFWPARYSGDAGRVQQMLTNLVSNALKHVAPGGHIVIRADTSDDGLLRYQVEDSGSGIPRQLLRKLFTPFAVQSAARQGRAASTGLGLALVRKLANAMGGEASVESTPGVGSMFQFTLDLPLSTLRAPSGGTCSSSHGSVLASGAEDTPMTAAPNELPRLPPPVCVPCAQPVHVVILGDSYHAREIWPFYLSDMHCGVTYARHSMPRTAQQCTDVLQHEASAHDHAALLVLLTVDNNSRAALEAAEAVVAECSQHERVTVVCIQCLALSSMQPGKPAKSHGKGGGLHAFRERLRAMWDGIPNAVQLPPIIQLHDVRLAMQELRALSWASSSPVSVPVPMSPASAASHKHLCGMAPQSPVLSTDSGTALPDQAAGTAHTSFAAGSPARTVAIIDDDAVNRKVLSSLVKSLDFTPLPVKPLPDELTRLADPDVHSTLCCVLVDYHMADVLGSAVAQDLRRAEQLHGLPRVAMLLCSGEAFHWDGGSSGSVQSFAQAGITPPEELQCFDGALLKPVRKAQLHKLLQSVHAEVTPVLRQPAAKHTLIQQYEDVRLPEPSPSVQTAWSEYGESSHHSSRRKLSINAGEVVQIGPIQRG